LAAPDNNKLRKARTGFGTTTAIRVPYGISWNILPKIVSLPTGPQELTPLHREKREVAVTSGPNCALDDDLFMGLLVMLAAVTFNPQGATSSVNSRREVCGRFAWGGKER
jgi:hypothetical protein